MAATQVEGTMASFGYTGQTDSILSTERKYHGLIKESFFKATRNRLFDLMSYLDAVVSDLYIMHTIVSVWRLIQLIGPCLVSGYSTFWREDSVARQVISYITFLSFLCPAQYRIDGSVIIQFVSIAGFFVFLVLVVWGAYHYRKASKLPDGMPEIIAVIQGSLMYLMPAMGMEAGCEAIGLVATGGAYKYPMGLEIFAFVATVLVEIVLLWFIINVNSISVVFRPTSLMTVSPKPSIAFFVLSSVVVFVTGLGSNLPKIGRIVCLLAAALIYAVIAYIPYMPGAFISRTHGNLIFAESVASGLFLILVAIYDIVDRRAAEVELFVLVGAVIVLFFLGTIITNVRMRKHVTFLDIALDDGEQLDLLRTPGQLITHICTGMFVAHPLCIEWTLFKFGTECWPENAEIWHIFAKFAAIYPEEDSSVALILHNVLSKKLSGAIAKATITQCCTVMRTRETNLSPGLKRKLNNVQKKVQTTKRKIRQIWDLVIQGNVNEMQGAVNMAYKSVERSHNDFNHLVQEYPNNKYVARAYCRFVQEILANQRLFDQWHDKLRLMQRGLRVNVDRANALGLHAYPKLPPFLVTESSKYQQLEMDSNVSSDVLEIEDDPNTAQTEQSQIIREKIDHLQIPSRACAIKTNLFLILFTIIIVGILSCVLVPWFVNQQDDPLQYAYHLSFLRSVGYQIPVFAHKYVFENYPTSENPVLAPADVPLYTLTAFNGAQNTENILQAILESVTGSLEALAEYRTYENDNPRLETAITVAFEKSIPYIYYTNQTVTTEEVISLQDAIVDFVITAGKLFNTDFTQVDVLNDQMLLNSVLNSNTIADQLSLALASLNDFIVAKARSAETLAYILMASGIVLFIVVYLIALCCEVKRTISDNKEVYRCLTALPKNVVSGISESLRILQKDNQNSSRASEMDTETNKQEENVMKILANAGDSSIIEMDKIAFMFCMIFCLLFSIIIVVLSAVCVLNISESLIANAPHINYVLGASGYLCGCLLALNSAVTTEAGHSLGIPLETLLSRFDSRLSTFTEYYHLSRFGGTDTKPNPSMEDGITAAAEKMVCPDNTAVPSSYSDIYQCFSADIQLILMLPFLIEIYEPLYNKVPDIDAKSDTMKALWDVGAVSLYDSFFYPMFQNLLSDLQDLMQSNIPPARTGIIIIMVLSVCLYIISILQLNVNRDKLLFTLNLLNHCPPQVLLQTPKIMDILSGDFTDQSKDKTQRDNEFFDAVVLSIPDAVLIANAQFVIEVANKATNQILHIPSEQLIGRNLKEFLSGSSFKEDLSGMLEDEGTNDRVQYNDPETGNIAFFEITSVQYNQQYAVTFRDQTQNVLYNTLIEEERMKSDRLLASILPANLVPRVQRGEKNISFAVQSASIIFMDIVEFTPWCASNTAQMVMQTLNHIYREFDALAAGFTTMTKIKCIGDCYMAAGGIFCEVNQPAQHAREVVTFGLNSIAAILSINQSFDQNLRIRAGVNTGGPIVAGVLGTEKPTFEILGPAINMAQQMEHNGVAMKVHISRPVYELIYGGSFQIKERGQIEIKNSSVLTYIVDPTPNT